MLENAVSVCEAKFGNLYAGMARVFTRHFLAFRQPYRELGERGPVRPGPNMLGALVSTKKVGTPDIQTDVDYTEREQLRVSAVQLGGARTYLAVPMLKERNSLVHRPCTAMRCVPSPTSRSSW